MNKRFNITGSCVPEQHYMVDITERLVAIKNMIDNGEIEKIEMTTGTNTIKIKVKEDNIIVSENKKLSKEEKLWLFGSIGLSVFFWLSNTLMQFLGF